MGRMGDFFDEFKNNTCIRIICRSVLKNHLPECFKELSSGVFLLGILDEFKNNNFKESSAGAF